MSSTYTLAEIAKWVQGVVRGDASVRISGVAGVEEAQVSHITWLSDDKYAAKLRSSRAGAVLVDARFGETPMAAILCEQPALAIVAILEHFAPPVPRPPIGAHPAAVVAPSARLGCDVRLGPNVVVGENAVIGDRSVLHANVFVGADSSLGSDCELWPGVVIRERCELGDRVVVHPNTTVGADGFGYQYAGGRHVKIPQIGRVVIEADVEIGANCCIDRAKFGDTRVGRGTKIDNLVQVAHNVQVGPGCILVAQCGIAGSTRLGRGVVLGGKVGVKDHVVLHDGVQVGACACISKDIPAGSRVMGIPAVDHERFVRERAALRRAPQMVEQIKALTQRIEQLEASADDRASG
ncbi:MAG: UDP-3-O-(3-hydroxymyristoyl)glucosamine N-acyltransferase [Phycisphaerae bacterium]|nr:UDP-3-O-(3-hydroxymyristoyl)glucosamine N-acyltransferase [Phycisphaerae bacterium]